MAYDRSDWKPQAQKVAAAKPMLHQLAVAAPRMETLTQSAEWNRYLQHLQAQVDIAKRGIEACVNGLTDPNITDPNEIFRLKITHAAFVARKQAFDEAMELPKQLIEAGDAAAKILAEIDPA